MFRLSDGLQQGLVQIIGFDKIDPGAMVRAPVQSLNQFQRCSPPFSMEGLGVVFLRVEFSDLLLEFLDPLEQVRR
uniref:Uncharacterized protein n=1 Tax=Candidatus Kentrum sp. SD TaxID=2126332 RepID=A0A451BM24_9GAMM|nr:MAG: hypothetical protein BECKSD772D_GA0070982_104318 [Candidatus Kentron sp. SD]